MKSNFKSCIFSETTKKQIDAMTDINMKLRFYEAVTNYGIYGIDPDFEGIDLLIWIPMKDIIDNATNKRGAPVGNANAKKANNKTSDSDTEQEKQIKYNETKKLPENIESNSEQKKQMDLIENKENNSKQEKQIKQLNSIKTNKTIRPNDNDNDNVNVNDNDNVNVNHPPPEDTAGQDIYTCSDKQEDEEVFSDFSENENLTQLAKDIYGVFVEAGINKPNTFLLFLQRDFQLGLDKLREQAIPVTPDILAACKNYAKVLALKKQQATWWNFTGGFDGFCGKNIILKFLPERFTLTQFEKNNRSPQAEKDYSKQDFSQSSIDEFFGKPQPPPQVVSADVGDELEGVMF
ncbi:hypothetical protein [Treponema phagedenis]|uniref:Uncharacterized protein n=1 Tax=Treponema phagedenis TaxID=162 RepID=A0AAE6IUB2_TREPH|nr:hypothetical protein [Treponema phagedenis]QEJ97407.1 hypothetical protein FUT82_04940 [Treponema phagedenis]